MSQITAINLSAIVSTWKPVKSKRLSYDKDRNRNRDKDRDWKTAPRAYSWISKGASICVGQNVTIGLGCTLGHNVIVEDQVTIGSYCSIGEGVHIGKDTYIDDDCKINGSPSIGKGCQIGAKCVVLFSKVGDNVTLCSGTTLDSSTAGNYCVVGTNTTLERSRIGANTHVGNNTLLRAVTFGEESEINEDVNLTFYDDECQTFINGTIIPQWAVDAISLGFVDGYARTLSAIPTKDGKKVAWITAGCRSFNLSSAVAHWKKLGDDRADTRAQIKFAATLAKSRGWISKVNTRDLT